MRPSDLQLDIDSYIGPFDLLCSILLRRELELSEVPLAQIVVGYVQRLAHEEQIDPNTAGEFLLLVAGLMEIKARDLLNQDSDLELIDVTSAESQEEMLERLIKYATFKSASRWLSDRAEVQRFWRIASRPVRRLAQGPYDGPTLDPMLLHRAMSVLLSQPDVDVRHLVGRHASVHEMTGRLLDVLRSRQSFTLDDAVNGLTRLDQAVAFVAALELCKSGKVDLSQDERFGPIKVTRVIVQGGNDEQHEPAEVDIVNANRGVQTA